MRKSIFIVGIIAILCCACGSTPTYTTETFLTVTNRPSDEQPAPTMSDREIISSALDISEDSRNIQYILNCLDELGIGSVLQADYSHEQLTLDILTEDSVTYRFYLNSNLTVDAVENLTSGNFVIQSYR